MRAIEQEICPNCGNFVSVLIDSTGWCRACSARYCQRCGSDQDNTRTDRLCGTCRDDVWLEENVDALEFYTSRGLTLREAKQKVLDDNRPYCLCCEQDIPHGKKSTSKFCTRTRACRSAKRRYRTLRNHFPPEVALQLTQQELLALREA